MKHTPGLIYSPLCREVTAAGMKIKVMIVRIEEEPGWTLEVVNSNGTSIVYSDKFESDAEADFAFKRTMAQEGVLAFVDDRDKANVIRFPTDRRR